MSNQDTTTSTDIPSDPSTQEQQQHEAPLKHADLVDIPLNEPVNTPKPPPYQINPNVISWVFMFWMDKLMWLGSRKVLEVDDLFKLNAKDLTPSVSKIFVPYWAQLPDYHKKLAEFKKKHPEFEQQQQETPSKPSKGAPRRPKGPQPPSPPSLLRVLFGHFARLWITGGLFYACSIGCELAVPTFIRQLIQSLQPFFPKEQLLVPSGYGIAVIIFLLQMGFTLFGRSSEQILRTITVNVRTAIIGAVYEKALKLSGEAQNEFSQGKILNLINVDAEAIAAFANSSHTLWVTPVQVFVTIGLLYNLLGNAVWAALGAMIASLVIQISLFGSIAGFQRALLKAGDARLKSIRELLYAIKIVKLHAWESIFATRIAHLRKRQILALRNFNIIIIIFVSMAQLTPIIMPIVAFIVYSRINPEISGGQNPLNPAVIFPALSLFQLLTGPLFVLPSIVSSFVRASVSWGRLRAFLSATESEPLKINVPKSSSNNGADPTISKVDPAYGSSESTLNINVEAEEDLSADYAIVVRNGTFKWQAVKKDEEEVKAKAREAAKKEKKAQKLDVKKSAGKSFFSKKKPQAKVTPLEEVKTTSDEVVIDTDVRVPSSEERQRTRTSSSSANPSASAADAPKATLEPLIKYLDLKIPRGKLTMVVGPVGSGKSSLLSALIGEMTQITGSVSLNGTVAFAPQEAWILTNTVEGNVAFGRDVSEIDPIKMEKALRVANLGPDLEMLPLGSKTQIGEKGINISGGQRQRVQIARAVYEDADIYLFDDPLSALDAHVGKQVFHDCMREALAGKTRVLVTHQLHFLPFADHVVVMQGGRVVEQGGFEELMGKELPAVEVKEEDGNGDGEIERKIVTLRDLMKSYKLDDHKQKHNRNEGEEGGEGDDVEEQEEAEKKKDEEVKDIQVEEERSKGSLKFPVWLSFFNAVSGFRILIPIILAALTQQALQVTTSFWLVWWSEFRFGSDVEFYLRGYGLLGFGQAVGMLGLNALALTGGFLASKYYHGAAMARILRAPMSFFSSQPIGRILNRFTKDISSVDQQIWVIYFFVIFSSGSLLSSITVMLYVVPVLAAPIAPLCVFYYLLLRFYRATVRELKRLDSNQRSPLYAHISETLAGIPSIRAYKAEQKFIERQRILTDASNTPSYLYLCTSIWISIRIEFLASLIILSLCLLGVSNTVGPALIGLALSYGLSVVQSIGFLLKSAANLESEMNAVDRLNYYATGVEQEPPAYVPAFDPPKEQWPLHGGIEIRNLEVRYPSRPDHAVIKNLNLSILPGEKIGIVGRTGSGKSTLLTALFRLLEPSQGTIEIDNVDISTLGLSTLRSRLQIITQEPVLFSGSIRLNLDVEGNRTDDELWEVLKLIGLKEYVDSLPEKLDSEIAEGGSSLSVGQRQLMCLGRSLLHKSKILVLDEATASVDQAADELIQKSIRTHFADSTVISIAHRLNTVAGFDKILVLDDGVAVEYDRPSVLMNQNGMFRQLAERTGKANFVLLKEIAAEHDAEMEAKEALRLMDKK
ncbi:Multidrug resistance-associated protein 1 [Chytridiales sp. JEL 0842]|nr:Multidrug resistance-associated protein 1 [Chytridiales sp. JEL 0842]